MGWLARRYCGDPGNCLSFVNAIKVNTELSEEGGVESRTDVVPRNQS